jgi:hypothetical protein
MPQPSCEAVQAYPNFPDFLAEKQERDMQSVWRGDR